MSVLSLLRLSWSIHSILEMPLYAPDNMVSRIGQFTKRFALHVVVQRLKETQSNIEGLDNVSDMNQKHMFDAQVS